MKISFLYFLFAFYFLLNITFLLNKVTNHSRPAYFSTITSSNDSIALENDYARVLRNSTLDSSADAEIFDKRILIALSTLTFKTQNVGYKVHRGEVVVYQTDNPYHQITGDFFEVAIKKFHPPVKGPDQWFEPLKNTIVYQDEQLRIFEERLDPGDTRLLHSHAQRVVIRLNQTQLTDPRFKPNGAPGEGIQVKNTVKFAEPMVHVVKNLSKTVPLFNIIIEFKPFNS